MRPGILEYGMVIRSPQGRYHRPCPTRNHEERSPNKTTCTDTLLYRHLQHRRPLLSRLRQWVSARGHGHSGRAHERVAGGFVLGHPYPDHACGVGVSPLRKYDIDTLPRPEILGSEACFRQI